MTFGLVLAFALCGQKVTLPASVDVPVGRLASIVIEHDGDDLAWTVPPQLDAFREYDPDPKRVKLRLIGYQTGTHRLIAVTTKAEGGKAKLSPFAVCEIKVGGGTPPPPDPQPNPNPDPGPTPTVQPIFVSFWSETSTRRPEDRAVLSSAEVRKACGEFVRVYDPDVEPAKYAKFKPWLDTSGMPAMAIQNRDTGKVLEVVKMPAKEADALALIRKWGGSK